MANSPTIREKGSDGIEFTAAIPASQPGDVFPAGVMLDFAGSAAPTGWLVCDGSLVSRATYPNLFSAIGIVYGAGDGSTTFGIPDTRGKVRVGKHSSGTFTTLGATGGAESVSIDVTQMPAHNHGGATTNASPNTGGESNDHLHGITDIATPLDGGANVTGLHQWGSAGSNVRYNGATAGRNVSHTHTVDAHAHGINSQGGGAGHANLQPYIVLNHIIRAY